MLNASKFFTAINSSSEVTNQKDIRRLLNLCSTSKCLDEEEISFLLNLPKKIFLEAYRTLNKNSSKFKLVEDMSYLTFMLENLKSADELEDEEVY